jgi:hypothetical protein
MRLNLTSQRPRALSLVSMEKSFEGELGKEKTWMAVLHTTIILSLLNLSKEDHRYIDTNSGRLGDRRCHVSQECG